MESSDQDIPILQAWYSFASWLFDLTEKFPRRIRLTLTSRIDSLVLDILEDIVEAKYRREKMELLFGMNRKLERLRFLLRLCHDKRHLSTGAFEGASRRVDECGRMLGGWIRELREA